jgi:hypothetical protein
MSNYWLNKEATMKFDAQWIINSQIANEINWWLHQKGKDALVYGNYLDRVMDLQDVIKIGVEKGKKIIAEYPEMVKSN